MFCYSLPEKKYPAFNICKGYTLLCKNYNNSSYGFEMYIKEVNAR